LYPNLTPIKWFLRGLKTDPPKLLDFKCPLKDDYFVKLAMFGFVYKLDHDADYFTSSQSICEGVNSKFKKFQEQ
jgi:hypothetical protein